jgi:DNA-binding FadR family transcriptional regulator
MKARADILSPLREVLRKQTTKGLVRDKIISLIASGILQPGDELPSERELSTSLSVSRETVRGAIQLLAGEGILRVSQGARTRVLNVDVDVRRHRIGVTNRLAIDGYPLQSVHEARLLVEIRVVADAALHISDSDLRRLEASLVVQEAAANNPLQFLICDREFHLTIYYASTNRLLADFVVDLYTFMLDYRRLALAKRGAIRRSLQDHRDIVAALLKRDPERTAAAFTRHIMRIRDTTAALRNRATGLVVKPVDK